MPARAPVDLLPLLRDAWRAAVAANPRCRTNRVARWVEQASTTAARLTIEPSRSATSCERWLGTRLAWWPRGIPAGRRVGLASSRLGRALESHSAWFTYLRAACEQVEPEQDILFTAAESTTARFVERCARLYGLRVLRADVAADGVTWARWVRRLCMSPRAIDSDSWFELLLSPPLDETRKLDSPDRQVLLTPARDRALVALCDRLLVFHVRAGGNLHRLLRARLDDPAWPVASVFVAIGPQLVSRGLADELLGRGAVGWLLFENVSTVEPPRRDERAGDLCDPAPILGPPASDNWPFLTHCTRRQNERWPDESEDEFLDTLILHRDEADHSAFAALARIVTNQRLRAASKAVRGGFPVVSFTAAPLADLPKLRVFRAHRGRWDFEPYGICIRRDWLARLDCRAVQYGNDEYWQTLLPQDQPFFQKSGSARSRHKPGTDWTVEREWRHVGDVDLTSLNSDEAFVFVPTRAEAERLARVSRWPVVVREG